MLQKLSGFPGIKGPVVTIVMDGFGITPNKEGNAIAAAQTPIFDWLMQNYSHVLLKAHGRAVGMPSNDDMGNSEVGHNAIGSGQVYNQGAALVADAIASGEIFERDAWKEISSNVREHGSTLHFIGLFSDGNVHSHIDHLTAMIRQAKKEGLKRVRVHILLDGRDVPETSALEYVGPFEQFLDEVRSDDFDVCIASGGGRMVITMDRYNANWHMVELGWQIHVLGEGRQFASAKEAIETLRGETQAIDQDLPPFVIAKNGEPVGPINDGDSVVFFNFRGDRALEITRAFEDETFTFFDRKRHPKVCYAGMLQYDGDLKLPTRFLVPPPAIRNTGGQWLSETGLKQFACSETQKYGHVTYFWNGNRSGKFDGETYLEIQSDIVPFEQRPWMKAAEITDSMIEAVQSGKYQYLRCNFANGDMVGHTGSFRAATMAIEAVDLGLRRLLPVIKAMGGIALITADHGNADEMYEVDKKTGKPKLNKDGSFKAKTSHTLNPVPFILYDDVTGGKLSLKQGGDFGISNIAATAANLLGYQKHESWDDSMLIVKP